MDQRVLLSFPTDEHCKQHIQDVGKVKVRGIHTDSPEANVGGRLYKGTKVPIIGSSFVFAHRYEGSGSDQLRGYDYATTATHRIVFRAADPM